MKEREREIQKEEANGKGKEGGKETNFFIIYCEVRMMSILINY